MEVWPRGLLVVVVALVRSGRRGGSGGPNGHGLHGRRAAFSPFGDLRWHSAFGFRV